MGILGIFLVFFTFFCSFLPVFIVLFLHHMAFKLRNLAETKTDEVFNNNEIENEIYLDNFEYLPSEKDRESLFEPR